MTTTARFSASAPWSDRWARLAAGVGLEPGAPVLVALSGGADSVLVAHLVAAARPRPDALLVHVAHGLRGEESEADAAFCGALAAELGLPFELARAPIDPAGPSLEARARDARYAALCARARRDARTVVTGHHADDALETVLLRWVRGTALGGLAGPRRRVELAGFVAEDAGAGAPPVTVVRPLHRLRREEVRELLASRGLRWRDDSTNAGLGPTRNRVRNRLLPLVRGALGPEGATGAEGIEGLFAFARAVEDLEEELARRTAHVEWRPLAIRGVPLDARESGRLPRAVLMELPAALRRRVLVRLLGERGARPPRAGVLERILGDLGGGRCARHQLPGARRLELRGTELRLLPAPAAPPRDAAAPLPLDVPGAVELADGRRIEASLHDLAPGEPAVPSRDPAVADLDATRALGPLAVRAPRAGDRVRALGAPGSRPLARVLADAGVPRAERAGVPLVVERTPGGDERVLWIAGVRPAAERALPPTATRRLRLSIGSR